MDCLASFGFFPTISIPTRISTIPPYSETLIDNIFTNSLSSVLQSCTVCTGIADHLAILCSTSILSPRVFSRIPNKLRTRKFNFSRIEELKTNITEKLTSFNLIADPEQACDTLISIIQREMNNLSSHSEQRTTPIQPWTTPAILKSINTRGKLLKEFLRNRSTENETKFKRFRNVLRLTLRLAKKHYFQNQFEKKMLTTPDFYGKTYLRLYRNRKRSIICHRDLKSMEISSLKINVSQILSTHTIVTLHEISRPPLDPVMLIPYHTWKAFNLLKQ